MDKLFNAALEAFNNSYSPYSHFKVGASILLKNGEIINGCNVENAAYGVSNCAERTAIFTCYAKGYRKDDIDKIMVIGDTEDPISPCGACRQVLSELMDNDCEVILTNLKKDYKIMKVKDLLPYSFNKDVL
jgi:cytidine deaminase